MTTVKKQNDTTQSLCIEANKMVSEESASNRIPVGWQPLLANVCEEIKQLLLPHNSSDVISYFYPTIRESRLKVFITLDEKIDSTRRDAIISLIDETNMLSEYICHKCGGRATGKKSLSLTRNTSFNLPVCDSHSLQEMEEKKEEPQKEKSSEKDWKSLLEEDDVNDKSSTNKMVQVYCLKQVKESLERAPEIYKDSDSKYFVTKVLKTLMKENGKKEIVPLPKHDAVIFNHLLEMFPNFSEVIEMLRGASAVANLSQNHYFPPILLLGEPGLGKTLFAETLAKQLNMPCSIVRMENQQSGAGLMGSSDFWANAKTGEIFNLLTQNNIANPLLVIDEVDKAQDGKYSPINSLYSVLERHTAKSFADECLPFININASYLNWVLTANDKKGVPEPLLSRMVTYEIPKPTKKQAEMIAKNIYLEMINSSQELSNKLQKEMRDDVLDTLIQLPPRRMKMEIEFAIGRAIIANRNQLTVNDIRCSVTNQKSNIGFV